MVQLYCRYWEPVKYTYTNYGSDKERNPTYSKMIGPTDFSLVSSDTFAPGLSVKSILSQMSMYNSKADDWLMFLNDQTGDTSEIGVGVRFKSNEYMLVEVNV
jgi:hypothetical protein